MRGDRCRCKPDIGQESRFFAYTPLAAHSALRLAVDGHQAGVEAPARTTLPNVGAADRGRHWAQRQRRLEDRT